MKKKYMMVFGHVHLYCMLRGELPEIIRKMSEATKVNGVIYLSFKYGDFEGERSGRHFTDMTENAIAELLMGFPELEIEKQWITRDVRSGRGNERRLNTILRK